MPSEYGAPAMQKTAREKQSELPELHFQFQELGQRLEKCLFRIRDIGNKLVDESGSLSEQKPSPTEPSPRLPGIVSDLYRDYDGFRGLISDIEHQLSKLEKII